MSTPALSADSAYDIGQTYARTSTAGRVFMAGQELHCEQERLIAVMMAVIAENDQLKNAKLALDQEDALRESAQEALYGRVTANWLAEKELSARLQSRIAPLPAYLLAASGRTAPGKSPALASLASAAVAMFGSPEWVAAIESKHNAHNHPASG